MYTILQLNDELKKRNSPGISEFWWVESFFIFCLLSAFSFESTFFAFSLAALYTLLRPSLLIRVAYADPRRYAWVG